MMDGAKNKFPKGSRFFSFSIRGRSCFSGRGRRRMNTTMRTETAPMGLGRVSMCFFGGGDMRWSFYGTAILTNLYRSTTSTSDGSYS